MIAWVFMHWALLPVGLAMSFMGLGYGESLENELWHPVLAFLTAHWVPLEPFMQFPLRGVIFSAVLTLVALILAVRATPHVKPSSRPATLA